MCSFLKFFTKKITSSCMIIVLYTSLLCYACIEDAPISETLDEEKSLILSSRTLAYKMSYEDSVDIDDEIDLLIAKGVHMGLSKAIKRLDE